MGCESARYQAAREHDTIKAYQRYLARHPRGDGAATARRRLEQIRFQQARQVDRPLGYRSVLQRHPEGRHARECRERLADLALSSAKTPAALELVVERYPGSRQARTARQRLPAVIAQAALASSAAAPSRDFLDRFATSPQAQKVKDHLSRILYRKLPELQVELESFVQRFRATPSGRKALKRLEALLSREVRRTPSNDLLRQFAARFPKSEDRAELQALVRRVQWDKRLASLDVEALRTGSRRGQVVPTAVSMVLSWCKRDLKGCATLRRIAAKAGPWRPATPFEVLRQRSYDPDMQAVWQAISALSWSEGVAAGDHLAELLGSARLSVVWAAAAALDRWLGRRGVQARTTWLARRLKRPYRAANLDEVQRAAYLKLLASGKVDAQLDGPAGGRRLLTALMTDQGRPLTAAYLLVRWELRRSTPSSKALSRLLAAAKARMKWLKDAFPSELHKESLVAGVLAERELFAISCCLEAIKARAGAGRRHPAVADSIYEAEAILAAWRLRLAKTSKSFRPAGRVDLQAQVARHQRGRRAALLALARHQRVGRPVAGAICRLSRIDACATLPSQRTGTTGGNKTVGGNKTRER